VEVKGRDQQEPTREKIAAEKTAAGENKTEREGSESPVYI
jgi:hypothetical protein